jgi:hypothetical protein
MSGKFASAAKMETLIHFFSDNRTFVASAIAYPINEWATGSGMG